MTQEEYTKILKYYGCGVWVHHSKRTDGYYAMLYGNSHFCGIGKTELKAVRSLYHDIKNAMRLLC